MLGFAKLLDQELVASYICLHILLHYTYYLRNGFIPIIKYIINYIIIDDS